MTVESPWQGVRTMSSMIRIRQIYPALAQNDRKLADFLLEQPEQARHLSSQKLAELVGVSQSGLVKFAQKLGYKGFPALKLDWLTPTSSANFCELRCLAC